MKPVVRTDMVRCHLLVWGQENLYLHFRVSSFFSSLSVCVLGYLTHILPLHCAQHYCKIISWIIGQVTPAIFGYTLNKTEGHWNKNIVKRNIMYCTLSYKNKHKQTEICLLKAYTMSSWRCLSEVFLVTNKQKLKCTNLSTKCSDCTTTIALFSPHLQRHRCHDLTDFLNFSCQMPHSIRVVFPWPVRPTWYPHAHSVTNASLSIYKKYRKLCVKRNRRGLEQVNVALVGPFDP